MDHHTRDHVIHSDAERRTDWCLRAAGRHEPAEYPEILTGRLVLARTSDQPLQVHDKIELFTRSLIEAWSLSLLWL